jgi:hypothetical protein
MIELTLEQTRALDVPPQPVVAVDPRTGQEYLLIRREIYDKIRLMLKPFGATGTIRPTTTSSGRTYEAWRCGRSRLAIHRHDRQ